MKILVFIMAILFAFTGRSFAQQFNAEEFNKHLGKTGVVCDTVKTVRIMNDTLTYLSMGAPYPNQKYMIEIRGNKINVDFTILKGKPLCVSGVFEFYKNQYQIIVAEPKYFDVH